MSISSDEAEEQHFVQEQLSGKRGGRHSKKERAKLLLPSPAPPPGLISEELQGPRAVDLLEAALAEMNSVLSTEVAGQMSANQHFFINLPFPLKKPGAASERERSTPCFRLFCLVRQCCCGRVFGRRVWAYGASESKLGPTGSLGSGRTSLPKKGLAWLLFLLKRCSQLAVGGQPPAVSGQPLAIVDRRSSSSYKRQPPSLAYPPFSPTIVSWNSSSTLDKPPLFYKKNPGSCPNNMLLLSKRRRVTSWAWSPWRSQ